MKPATIRTVLTIVVTQSWQLRQLDVNNAFLHGLLNEDVYMVQPPGFKDDTTPHHVRRLNKAIYGLKQAPRAWYSTLRGAILEFGVVNSRVDSSLFIYNTKSVTCYFLVYVDDLVITGNDPIFVSSIIVQLSNRFSLKDMGQLHFFSGHGGYSHYHKSLFVSAQIHQRLINKDEHAWSKKGYHSTIHNYCAQAY